MSSQEDSDEITPASGNEPGAPVGRASEASAKRPAPGANASYLGRAGQFIRDVRSEMKRVSWPTFEDVRNTTVIVLINVIFFAAFLFLVDQGWGYTIRGFDWAVGKLFGAA